MSSIRRGAVVNSIQRLFDEGTVVSLGERQLLDRFLTRADESAFEAIVGRHGPMVLSVCRHVLADEHDVEDAFQATFLVLVTKAGSIRDRDVLGTWLYGVARRVAVRAQTKARRRQSRECPGVEGIDVRDDRCNLVESNEIRTMVGAELDRLPQRLRDPLILCDLEGRTHEQAALELRCPVGTVKSRLSRGRKRLRARLARRGLATPSLLPGPMLVGDPMSAVPIDLLSHTVRAATQCATKNLVSGGLITARSAALTKGVIHTMAMTKLKIAMAACLIAGLTGAGGLRAVKLIPALPSQGVAWAAGQPDQQVSVKPGSETSRIENAEAISARQAGREQPTPQQGSVRIDKTEAQTPVEPGSERFVLDNGLTVLLRPIRGSTSIALTVLYSIGSDHDPAGRSGLTHMVEHLYVTAAAGQEKARTAEEFARRYALGANAQTGHRYTVFAAVFPTKALEVELRDAAARMGDLRITAADLDRERPRLLEEVDNMFGAMPMLGALNSARELVRPTSAGGRAGGSPEHLRALKPEEARAYWQRYYKPRSAILALAGDIDTALVRKAIEAHFGTIPSGEKAPSPLEPEKPILGKTRELTVNAFEPDAASIACLAYAAPEPGNETLRAVSRARVSAMGRRLETRQRRTDRLAGLLHAAR